MTILATQNWITPPDYLIERSAFWGIAFVWWTDCILSVPPNMVMRETPFGGYRVRMTLLDSFWHNRSSAWRHDEILTNLYAMSPGSDTPINMGNVNRLVVFYPTLLQYVLVVQCDPSDGHYAFYRLPPATENAGFELMPNDLPPIFFADPTLPGVLLPPVYC